MGGRLRAQGAKRKPRARGTAAERVVLESANHLPLPGSAACDPALDTLLEFLAG